MEVKFRNDNLHLLQIFQSFALEDPSFAPKKGVKIGKHGVQ
jgi:hypothetical protein